MTIYWPDEHRDPLPGAKAERFRLQVSKELLERHGARVLDPATATRLPRAPAPKSTMYSSSVLLVDRQTYKTKEFAEKIVPILKVLGLEIAAQDPDKPDPDEKWPDEPWANIIPKIVVLRVAADGEPAVIDAWTALQHIRLHAPEISRNISLDHLLIASSVDVGSGVPGAGQGWADPDVVTSLGYERRPVALTLPPTHRTEESRLPGGRRPVVAILDTGIRYNRWLGVSPWNSETERMENWNTGEFVSIDPDIQNIIHDVCLKLRSDGANVEVLSHPKDEPVSATPLVGELDSHTGHGTFIAGIVKQHAPDARVLAVRVMSSDGIVRKSVLLAALGGLVRRIDAGDKVDVVSLSLGFPPEDTRADEFTSPLALAINVLRTRGVVVVAAAGNSATSTRFAPAAFADHANPPPVISVSALNPNGSKAVFGNDGSWVLCWATGAGVVSAFPEDVNASRAARVRMTAVNGQGLPQTRESTDGDDYSSGFAVWWGTSFAAPSVAARIATMLITPLTEEEKANLQVLEYSSPSALAVERVRAEARRSPPELAVSDGRQ